MTAYIILQWKAERALEFAKTATTKTNNNDTTIHDSGVLSAIGEEISANEQPGDSDI